MSQADTCSSKRAPTARKLFLDYERELHIATDRMFAWLMFGQWIFGIVLAVWCSPYTWSGSAWQIHPHVWSAVLLGAAISGLPIALVVSNPGTVLTRHAVAIAQSFTSALLIHVSGGRIETHFHVFGSLAFLAFYRDWRVLMSASLIVAADHIVRGIVWPQSVYGVLDAGLLRSFEHAGWVVFEDVFLILACTRSRDEMMRIAVNEAALREAYQEVEAKVEERTAQLAASEQRLLEAKQAAEAASRSKSEFLANMSHEIRTPMTAILGYADLLMEEGDLTRSPERRVEVIQIIQKNGEHLLWIINDILDLSKIEAGKLTLESIACSPVAVVEDVWSLMQVRAHGKGLVLAASYETDVPASIQTDPTRLRQILMNLVGNAIKFTETGSVRMYVRFIADVQPRLEFDVVDTGIGMTDEQRERLFQPFSQADGSTTRTFGGTGLGLSISKRLATMLGGDITIVESAPGRGTRFRLVVSTGPLEGVPLIDPRRGANEDRHADSKQESPSARMTLHGYRVLLAEDAPDNQRLISFVLRKAGAEVTVVANGQQTVDAAWQALDSEHPFDVILMDMQMPVLDGFGATALLRAKGYRGRIIALTANAMSGDRDKCLAAGCDDYATKPINREVLIEQIGSVSVERGAECKAF